MVSNNLDNQSLIALKESSKEVSNSIEEDRFIWIRIVKRYNGNFKKFKNSWMEVLQKTSVDDLRQLANAVQKFFASFSYYIVSKKQLAPLHVAAVQGDLQLCELIITKTSEKNPGGGFCIGTCNFDTNKFGSKQYVGTFGFNLPGASDFYRHESLLFGMSTPLHIAAVTGNLELCNLILSNVVEKNSKSTNRWTPLHMAAANGHLEVARVIAENADDKNPIGSYGWTPFHFAYWNMSYLSNRLDSGSNVYVQHPVNKRWDSKAIIISRRSEKSYLIEIEKDGRQFLRNRKFLRSCKREKYLEICRLIKRMGDKKKNASIFKMLNSDLDSDLDS